MSKVARTASDPSEAQAMAVMMADMGEESAAEQPKETSAKGGLVKASPVTNPSNAVKLQHVPTDVGNSRPEAEADSDGESEGQLIGTDWEASKPVILLDLKTKEWAMAPGE